MTYHVQRAFGLRFMVTHESLVKIKIASDFRKTKQSVEYSFMYNPGDSEWASFHERPCSVADEKVAQPAFEAYLRRCPPKQGRDAAKNDGSYLD